MRTGRLFERQTLELHTDESDSSLWPTPVAHDDGKTPEAHMAMKARMPGGARRTITSLNVMVKAVERGLWPTPNVPNGGRSPKGGMGPTGITPDGKKRQVGLEQMVKHVEGGLWPTPKASADKLGRPRPNDRGDLQAAVTMFPTPKSSPSGPDYARRSREGSGGDDLATRIGGQLNPTWVEWLMGFPLGWTDCGDSATRSSRRSPK